MGVGLRLSTMNAACANLIVCAAPDCCQPGTTLILLAITDDYGPIQLEFCERHAAQRRGWATPINAA